MKCAEVQLPDPLYHQIEGLAKEQHISVADLLRRAAEEMVRQAQDFRHATDWSTAWQLPEGRHMGQFKKPVKDWRMLANETGPE